jgi:hypothetical protein
MTPPKTEDAPAIEATPARLGQWLSDRRRGTILDLGLALAAFLYFVVGEGYPALLASLAGAAIALLAFSARRTLVNLLDLRDRGYEIDHGTEVDHGTDPGGEDDRRSPPP